MPSCPLHGQEMRAGSKPGNFYCTQFVGLGAQGANAKGYCAQVINAPRAPRSGPPSGPSYLQTAIPAIPPFAPTTPVGDPLACAALQFAGSVFHGSQDGDKAVELARRAYDEMRGVA